MAKKKKDKKAIAKRSAKAQQRKTHKRKLRLFKSKPMLEPQYIERPPMAEMDAPPGFRAVSMTNALMEYSKSIIDFEDSENIEDLNKTIQFTSLLWNYAISVESGEVDTKVTGDILISIQTIWQVDEDVAKKLLDKFVARKNEMFPPEVQVKGSMFMYQRKEMTHLVAPFNYNQLKIADEIIPPDDDDKEFLQQLDTMDHYIHDGTDYGEWEDEYFSMEEACKKSFSNWLQKKGVPGKYSKDFPFLAEVFMNFVYRYGHDDVIVLKSVLPEYFEDFLFDHVLRKVMMEPHEHVEWPPALKLFYSFLAEKGYLIDVEQFVGIIDSLERQFIDVLRERYG